jgi:DNA-binding transcriptional LysR family regulator
MVEAGLGVGVIPSFWLAACAGRAVVATQLAAPIVRLDFQMIRPSGRKFPPVAEEFVSFLHSRIVDWAIQMRATR